VNRRVSTEKKAAGGRTVSARAIALIMGTVLVLGLAGFLSVRFFKGRGLGLWRFADLGQAVLDSRSVVSYRHGDFTDVIFLHHSVGRNLIEQGGIRNRFAEAGFSFWDHDYNWEGLRYPDGHRAGYSYVIPEDNTDPDGLAKIFAQPTHRLPLNALSGLLQHEVIAFKSCYPASSILSDEQLAAYKSHYLSMRDVMDQHRDRIFIIITPPPLNPAETSLEAAARARAFADWLMSDEFLHGHPNVFTFDLFDALAESDPALPDANMLREPYRTDTDSHPNLKANEAIGPVFVDFVLKAVGHYRGIDEP
jgi:hypothetical protein